MKIVKLTAAATNGNFATLNGGPTDWLTGNQWQELLFARKSV